MSRGGRWCKKHSIPYAAAAAKFARDLDSAARTLCLDRYSTLDLEAFQICKEAVREEAMEKLGLKPIEAMRISSLAPTTCA